MNAYSVQLKGKDTNLNRGELDFLSCSGDSTAEMLTVGHYGREPQLDSFEGLPPRDYAL